MAPTPCPTASLGPSSELPDAIINTLDSSGALYFAYNPSDITSEGSFSYSTFCRPGQFLNVQVTKLPPADGGNGEVFCINNTKNTSKTQLGYGSESPNEDFRFPTMGTQFIQ